MLSFSCQQLLMRKIVIWENFRMSICLRLLVFMVVFCFSGHEAMS